MKKNIILTLVLLSEMFILGCSPGGGPAGERKYFLLDLQRQGETAKPQENVVLMVRPFHWHLATMQKELTYRKSKFQYESDYYNQFVTDVGQQIAEQTRNWLSESGYFANVVPPGSALNATHMLEGNITRLYGDFRDKSNAKAFMSITFYLMDITKQQPDIILSESIEVQTPIANATAESLVEAYQNCLGQILAKLEKQLMQTNLTNSM